MEISLISLKIAFVALISCLCGLMLGDACIISLAYVHWGVGDTQMGNTGMRDTPQVCRI